MSHQLDAYTTRRVDLATQRLLDGSAFVTAGPGSGKSTLVAHVIARLVEHAGVDPSNVLALTFSRSDALALGAKLAKDHPAAEGVECSTIHALGLRYLRRVRGFDLHMVTAAAADPLLDQCRQNAGLAYRGSGLPHNKTIYRVFCQAVSHAPSLQAVRTGSCLARYVKEREPRLVRALPLLRRLWPKWARVKQSERVLDFGDLLSEFLDLLQSNRKVAARLNRRHRYLVVDEAQDLGALQFEVVRCLAGPEPHVLMAFDEAQTAYGFLGADPRHLFAFQRAIHVAPADTLRLERCHRSTEPVVRVGQALLDTMTDTFPKKLRAHNDEARPIRPVLVEASDADAEARWVANEIARLRRDEHVALKDIGVLYRTRAAAAEVRKALDEHHPRPIRWKVAGRSDWPATQPVRDVAAHLRCALGAAGPHMTAQVLRCWPGVGTKEAARITRSGQGQPLSRVLRCYRAATTTALDSLDALSHLLADVKKGWATPLSAVKRVVVQYRRLVPAQRRKAAVRAFRQLVRFAAEYGALDTMLDDLDVAAASPFGSESSRSGRKKAVTLATIHGAKGGERQVIFLVGAAEGELPVQVPGKPTNLDEEHRLAYVAVTRAEERLYVSWPASRGPLSRFFAAPTVRRCFKRKTA